MVEAIQENKAIQLRRIIGDFGPEIEDHSPLKAIALFEFWEIRSNQKEMAEVLSSQTLEELKCLFYHIGSGNRDVVKDHFDNLAWLVIFEDQERLQRFIGG